jgi:uncharacterized protein (TIGR00369 family)
MSIWKTPISVDEVNRRCKDTLVTHLHIEFVEVGDDFLIAKMGVKYHHMQPMGIMHGGASCVLAETVGSVAGNYCVDISTHHCVGIEINVNHLKAVKEGVLFAKASPFHLGKKTHVWSIEITDTQKRLIAVSRLTLMVLERKD